MGDCLQKNIPSYWEGVLCGMRIVEFLKGVFCGISPVEILCGIRLFCRIKVAENVLVVQLCQLNRCTNLQSARPTCREALFCLARGDSKLIFTIALVGLR